MHLCIYLSVCLGVLRLCVYPGQGDAEGTKQSSLLSHAAPHLTTTTTIGPQSVIAALPLSVVVIRILTSGLFWRQVRTKQNKTKP